MTNNPIRTDALKWWRSLSQPQKETEVNSWKAMPAFDRRKEWSFIMISTSDITIEKIYRELVLEENFND